MRMILQELELDDRQVHNKNLHIMTTRHFLDKVHSLYISKLTLSPQMFEQELKQYFRDILDK